MEISVNGESRDVDDGLTVAGLIAHLELGGGRVAVAVNRDVVIRSEHASHILEDGDRVEIVTAVQGG